MRIDFTAHGMPDYPLEQLSIDTALYVRRTDINITCVCKSWSLGERYMAGTRNCNPLDLGIVFPTLQTSVIGSAE